MSNEMVVQVALWTDVAGHLSNNIRVIGTSPVRVSATGSEMMGARLRQLVIQSDSAKAVIMAIRAA
jgi:hypothetical protein